MWWRGSCLPPEPEQKPFPGALAPGRPAPQSSFSAGASGCSGWEFCARFFLVEGKTVARAWAGGGWAEAGLSYPLALANRVFPLDRRAGRGDHSPPGKCWGAGGGLRPEASSLGDGGPPPQRLLLGWVCGMPAPHSRGTDWALPPDCPLSSLGGTGDPGLPHPLASLPEPLAQSATGLMPASGSRLPGGSHHCRKERGQCAASPDLDSFPLLLPPSPGALGEPGRETVGLPGTPESPARTLLWGSQGWEVEGRLGAALTLQLCCL